LLTQLRGVEEQVASAPLKARGASERESENISAELDCLLRPRDGGFATNESGSRESRIDKVKGEKCVQARNR
jgi:hypothetical protein